MGWKTPMPSSKRSEAYPGKNPLDATVIDTMFRPAVKRFVTEKSRFTEAPTYSYMFTAEMPLDGGKAPWHCADIPFVFHNIDKTEYGHFPGADGLQEQMTRSFVQFARTGDPNNALVPAWPPVQPEDEACMILDLQSHVGHNHDDELLALCREHAPKLNLFASEDVDVQH
jgi:para-nitrobenzyl esterase